MDTNASLSQSPQILPLWPDGVIKHPAGTLPEASTALPDGLPVTRNVSIPTLTAYLPEPTNTITPAVVICPGGAYHFLAHEHEGTAVARWLNAHGIAAFLLKYRLIPTGADFPQCVWDAMADREKMSALVAPLFPLITADACQALRLVRRHADGWRVDPARVGILGFSAGGMVTLSAALHGREDARPDFAAPIYAAPPPEAPIPADAPPLFLLCAADDDMASQVSTQYYSAWRAAGRPVELHIYARGGHGFGMNRQGLPSDAWLERFAEWLQAQGILSQNG